MRGTTLAHLSAGLLLLSGCTKSEPTVTGVVRVEGELLARGSISFVPVDGKDKVAGDRGPGGGATIGEGKYSIEKGLTVGKYRIEIQGVRQEPGKKMLDAFGSDVTKELAVVPTQYNKESKLIREVRAGSNNIDFLDLKGMPVGGRRN
jgi:hypothetical protein